MSLSKEARSALRKLIVEQIQALKAQLALNQNSGKTVELDQALAGRVSRIDAIQQQKMAQAAERRNQQQLNQLEQVLSRLDDANFGICEECAESISLARLRVKPDSRLCLPCQQYFEKTSR